MATMNGFPTWQLELNFISTPVARDQGRIAIACNRLFQLPFSLLVIAPILKPSVYLSLHCLPLMRKRRRSTPPGSFLSANGSINLKQAEWKQWNGVTAITMARAT